MIQEPEEWSPWYQHSDNPGLLEKRGVRDQWIYWRTAPRGDQNPDGNYALTRDVYDPDRAHYPDDATQFCGVVVDGHHYGTRREFVEKMQGISKAPIRYTMALRMADWFRWADGPLRKRRRMQRELAGLPTDQDIDLVLLFNKGFVRAQATGQTITGIDARVESLVGRRLRVVVSAGTYFVSLRGGSTGGGNSGGHQNMVARRPCSFSLEGGESRRFHVEAACINASLRIPGEEDGFHGVARVPEKVARFLEASRESHAMVVQAGVWALTDGYSGAQVQQHLVGRDRNGNVRQVVTEAHIAEARRLLDGLRIRHGL